MNTQENEKNSNTTYCHLCQQEVETTSGVVENVLHCKQCHALVSGYQAARTNSYGMGTDKTYC